MPGDFGLLRAIDGSAPDELSHRLTALMPRVQRRLLAYEPRLPTTDAVAPYLRRIDQVRMYSNQGPLVRLLQKRLQSSFGLADGSVVTTSSGTAALVAAIMAHAGTATADRPYAVCPSYTFVATAAAASQCGFQPYLADVCDESWTLDPDRLSDHPMIDRFGVVVPVTAYGRAIDVERWARFQHETGVKVVIDAAAAIEAVADGTMVCDASVPLALSFHATKAFGCGEGGCILWSDPTLAARASQATNFGFRETRNSQTASLNGKMSEYHAAVALAELDGWATKRADFARAARAYRAGFVQSGLAPDDLFTAPELASNYVIYRCADTTIAETLQATMDAAGIETRFWYGRGMHLHDHLADAPRDETPVSERLGGSLLGLPMGSGLAASDIARVVAVVAAEHHRAAIIAGSLPVTFEAASMTA
ncbi:MAG: DegT/DnrJ/EryC1/StrS family aminotransferase [Novosphingobium sp.]